MKNPVADGFFNTLIMFLCLLPLSALAQGFDTGNKNDPDTIMKTNVHTFREYLGKQADDFQANSNFNSQTFAYARQYSSNYKSFGTNKYDQAAKSPYAKAQFMTQLAMRAQQLVQTAGTPAAGQSAQQLNTIGQQMAASSDPQFQQMGQLYQQEAQAIQAGDQTQAAQVASQISNMPVPVVSPSYVPTQQESVLVQALNFMLSGVIGNLGGVLGQLVAGNILGALGINNPQITAAVGQGGRSLATGNTAQAGTNTAVGVAGAGANAVNTSMNTINTAPRAGIASTITSGGAPSAGN